MNILRCVAAWALMSLSLVVPVLGLQPAARLQGAIVDDSTGKQLAARISIRNSCGQTLEIEGRDGAKVRDEASIRYLEKYVIGTIHWLTETPPFANAADRDDALRRAEKALAYYRSFLPNR